MRRIRPADQAEPEQRGDERRADIRGAAGLGLIVVLGFLAAFLLGPTYGGSMRHSDGSELTIAGVNAAVIVMAAAATVLGLLWARGGAARRSRQARTARYVLLVARPHFSASSE